MIERVAKEIFGHIWPEQNWDETDCRKVAHRAAVAAIEAMRDPTNEMVTAMRIGNMNIQGGYGGPGGWASAIDAALKDD